MSFLVSVFTVVLISTVFFSLQEIGKDSEVLSVTANGETSHEVDC